MTDKEIIKKLECCSADKNRCDECPIQYECQSSPLISPGEKEVLDFVKRQQAEIERLRNYEELYEELKAENLETIRLIQRSINSARVEAVKEFWERLKSANTLDERIISAATGDKLVKEMINGRGKDE